MTSRRKRAARLIHLRRLPAPERSPVSAAVDDGLDAAASGDGAAGTPSADGDDTLLESGIAEVFAAIRAAVETSGDDDDVTAGSDADEDGDAVTFRLLGELDRLWQRAA